MMNITIVAAGKIKEKFYSAAIDEYSKRLERYCKFEIIEVKDEKTPENPSEKEKSQVLMKEGERILAAIPKNSEVIALCVEGTEMSSERFAEMMSEYSLKGRGRLTFIIGGSMGLSGAIKNMADIKLSFSKMTFPHMLMRVVLTEQIYRGFTIIEGKTYHK